MYGIRIFNIADNESSDGTTDLLKALAELGIIRYLPFPNVLGSSPQIPAYMELMRLYSGDSDWTAFIDADEFLVPRQSALERIDDVISGIVGRDDIGAICLNWATYGSSNKLFAESTPVIGRFEFRGPLEWQVNRHYKSIVKNSAYSAAGENPHYFQLKPGYREVHADGSDVLYAGSPGISTRTVWDPIRINHYVIKSRDEFLTRKRPRGRATIANVQRSETFFDAHDRNDAFDPLNPDIVELVKREIKFLTDLVRSNIKGGIEKQLSHGSKSTSRSEIETRGNLPSRQLSDSEILRKVRGALDSIDVEDGRLILRGWAVDDVGNPIPKFAVMAGSRVFGIRDVARIVRKDVARKVTGASVLAGFLLSCDLSAVEGSESIDDFTIIAGREHSKYFAQVAVGKFTGQNPRGAPNSIGIRRNREAVQFSSGDMCGPDDLIALDVIENVFNTPNSSVKIEANGLEPACDVIVQSEFGSELHATGPVFLPLRGEGPFPDSTRPPEIWFSHVGNALCTPGGIISVDGKIYSESFRHGIRRGSTSLQGLSSLTPIEPFDIIEEPILYLDGEHFRVFGHFFGEVFSRLWCVQNPALSNVKVVVGSIGNADYIYELLGLVGISADRLVELRRPALCRSLLVASQSHVVRTGIGQVGRGFYSMVGDCARCQVQMERVYISRRFQKSRSLVNEAEVERVFQRHGFNIVYPELLTIPVQIALFRDAVHLAGPSGSNLFGALLAKQVKSKIVLTGPNYILHNDVVMNSAARSDLHFYVGNVADDGSLDDPFSSWTVDVSRLEKFVDAWEESVD